MIRALDRGVGRVLDALEKHGLTENTLVIFTSDSGGAGYLGLPRVNDPFRGWKITYFEGGVSVSFNPGSLLKDKQGPMSSLRTLGNRCRLNGK